MLAGVLPTPAVALMAQDLGAVVTASHNPPEYNGVKFFDREGQKLTDEEEAEIEALLDGAGRSAGAPSSRRGMRPQATSSTWSQTFGSDLSGLRDRGRLRERRLLGIAPGVFERLGAERDRGRELRLTARTSTSAAARPTSRCSPTSFVRATTTSASRSTATATACWPSTRRERRSTATRSSAIIALARGVDTVAVTPMSNLGFHRLMAEHGIHVVTTDVGDRYVLEALRREGAVLGGEQSGHVISLDGHVTGDGLAAALLLCACLGGRRLSEAAAVDAALSAGEGERAGGAERDSSVDPRRGRRAERGLDGRGRVLVRPSGTEPVVRVLAEAETEEEAEELCGRIAHLVREELG